MATGTGSQENMWRNK